eukprot:1156119-Pelagomonas_calceolata.AAC.3
MRVLQLLLQHPTPQGEPPHGLGGLGGGPDLRLPCLMTRVWALKAGLKRTLRLCPEMRRGLGKRAEWSVLMLCNPVHAGAVVSCAC